MTFLPCGRRALVAEVAGVVGDVGQDDGLAGLAVEAEVEA
jgi:hypothetical protein